MKEGIKKTVFFIVIAVVIGIGVGFLTSYVIDTTKSPIECEHTRDVYVHRLESKFDASREALAVEVDKYI